MDSEAVYIHTMEINNPYRHSVKVVGDIEAVRGAVMQPGDTLYIQAPVPSGLKIVKSFWVRGGKHLLHLSYIDADF